MNLVQRERLPLIHYVADSTAWAVAIFAAWWIRFDFNLSLVRLDLMALVIPVAIVVQGLFGYLFGLYRRRWRYGSFDEVIAVGLSVICTGIVIVFLSWPIGPVPNSVPLTATAFALLIGLSGRSAWRLYRTRTLVPDDAEPVVVVGAGEASEQIVRAMMKDPTSAYRPVAIVDDDPTKSRLQFSGVRVRGSVADVSRIAADYGVSTVLLAIPSAPQALRRHLAGLVGLKLLSLPSVTEMLNDAGQAVPTLDDIHPITEEELLGRAPSEIDTAAVAGYITGKRVLVTGAGGSIGSEICRQLSRFNPAALFMLDRDESGLHATQLSIEGRALLDSPELVLADLRDADRMAQVFSEHRPQVVFHAAALKHLTLLEQSPDEAWKTNVSGTQTVIELCQRFAVDHFVNISTDKAADPTCVLGYTKRITERLTADAARRAGVGTFISVRFGNVLGSRGSVLTAFSAQSLSGGPITVTDAEVTRYFMTIEEASMLTIYAGAIGQRGQALVLDMGDPVRIVDVAERFANRVTPPLEIVFTGLRPGEKLHEVLLGHDEDDQRPVHPLISHVEVPPLTWEHCRAFAAQQSPTSGIDVASLAQLAKAVRLGAGSAAS